MRRKKFCSPSILAFALSAAAMLPTTTGNAYAQGETLLHFFNVYANGDAFQPEAPVIFDASGNLYGTGFYGGTYDYGAVFQMTPHQNGRWTESVLYSFAGQLGDAANPTGGVIFDSLGNLYGTTTGGGANGGGTVFELTPAGGGLWNEQLLFNFTAGGAAGSNPKGTLVFDASGNLFGTTSAGGAYGLGTVFEMTPQAGGVWSETVLHSFGNGLDGSAPYAGLTMDASGNFYGTTPSGGPYGNGVVFKLTRDAGGDWSEGILHVFNNSGDGAESFGGLTFDPSGNLYGTTLKGGAYGLGTVFELKAQPGGSFVERVLHSFNDDGTDGFAPYGNILVDLSGNLYGTTSQGGSDNLGTVFQLRRGNWMETILHSFEGRYTDGSDPNAGLTPGRSGNLYGTTAMGGFYDQGSVFEIR